VCNVACFKNISLTVLSGLSLLLKWINYGLLSTDN